MRRLTADVSINTDFEFHPLEAAPWRPRYAHLSSEIPEAPLLSPQKTRRHSNGLKLMAFLSV